MTEGRARAKISVIVPMYQAARWLPVSLPGYTGQDFAAAGYELIFVDNNSRDGAAEMAARGAPGAMVLQETRQGAYAARNRGAKAASGSILAFCDPDCVPAPRWLSEIEAAFGDERVQIVLGGRRFAHEGPLLSGLADYEMAKDAYMARSGRMDLCYGFTNNMAIRREAFERFGPFEELARGADSLFARRVVRALGFAALAFSERAMVRHLEIGRVRDYLAKMAIYAGSRRRNSRLDAAAPFTMRDRLRVWRRARTGGSRWWSGALVLPPLLALGALCWQAGGWRAERLES